MTKKRYIKFSHPGKVLLREFLEPLGITAYKLAKDISVPRNRITEIINGKRDISAETALLLSRYLNTSAEVWLNLQAHYDYEMAKEDKTLAKKMNNIIPIHQQSALA